MTADPLRALEDSFSEKGWFSFKFPDSRPIEEARRHLLEELRRVTGETSVTLETYHEKFPDDARHTELQIHMTAFFRERRFGPAIIRANQDFFERLLGRDVNVQSNPYLRITRPGKPHDNVGFHRDTFYGGSPYELSVWIPMVSLDAKSALSVLSGSHRKAESDFPTTQIQNPDPLVTKGSPKQKLGFLYAPKLIAPAALKDAVPVPLSLGEAMIFSLSLVHGSVENKSSFTRWSTDVRVMHALAPVDLSLRPDYYEPLCASVVTGQAREYMKANA